MQRVRKREIFCYGMGDFACNGYFIIVTSYLMYFYTDIACLPLATVGIAISVSRIVDAISCLAMGGLIDRTDTRWGKIRPYLAGLAGPLCVSLITVFYVPQLPTRGKMVYAFVTVILFSILYSGLSVAYSAMMSCMTKDDGERLSFNLVKSICANLGAFFVTSLTLVLVRKLGGADLKRGFVLTMMGYGIIYTIILLVCFWQTRERIRPPKEQITWKESFQIAIKNRHWITLCIIQFLMLACTTMRNQGALYYAKYFLEKEELGSVLLSISTFLAIPMMFVVTKLVVQIGKKRCMSYGMACMIIGILGSNLAGHNITGVLLFHILASIGWGIASGMVFVMIAEVVDYSEYQTGKRPQGFLSSIVSLMMKLGVASAGFLSARVLELGNYTAGEVANAQAIRAIVANFIWLPAIVALICLIVIQFYTLDNEKNKVRCSK